MASRAIYRTLEDFKRRLDPEKLRMPAMPDVAARVQQLAVDPDASPEDLAAVISNDAALTAQVIRIANSMMARHLPEVRTIGQAVARLGISPVSRMALIFAIRNTLKVRSAFAAKELSRSWAESKEVAAISSALAQMTRKLPADQAMLGGMLHRIGALPLLAALDDQDIDPGEHKAAQQAIEELHPELGSKILRDWFFAEDIAIIPETYRDPCRPDEGPADLSDVVAVAYVIHRIAEGNTEWLPPLGSFESGRRLGLDCSVESLQLISQDEKVDEGRSVLE